MTKPRIAILSFPGNNCEVESIRSISSNGMQAVFCRWNGGVEQFENIDGYFIPGGFSYEDRGRAGMVTARDPIMAHIADETARGKPVIGNCNGAQVLIETGLVPLGDEVRMSLARNAVDGDAKGFLNEWIYITPSCPKERCCTSDWEGAMHIPIAHGEGRFTTKDKDLVEELGKQNQIAFSYCDAAGNISEDPIVTPNGSEYAIAGICNPEGNVVALMPHPERTPNGDAYFQSLKKWIESHPVHDGSSTLSMSDESVDLPQRDPTGLEIFIDTIIVNNEERTVEQAARKSIDSITLKQLKYFSLGGGDSSQVLNTISLFNPNKEVAYIRKGTEFFKWDADNKREVKADSILSDLNIVRRDEPDTGGKALGQGSETGVCYVCSGASKDQILRKNVLGIFGNVQSSTLELL